VLCGEITLELSPEISVGREKPTDISSGSLSASTALPGTVAGEPNSNGVA
jgi:hypothetical protein